MMEDSIKTIVELLEKDRQLLREVEEAIAAYESKKHPTLLSTSQQKEIEHRKAQHLGGEGSVWSWEEVEQRLAVLRGI